MTNSVAKVLAWTIGVAISLALACATLVLTIFTLVQFGSSYLPILILGTVPTIFLAVLVHETGHLLAGLLSGFRVNHLIAGPLMILRQNGSIRVRLIKPSLGSLGQVRGAPVDGNALSRRAAFFISGGPLASLGAGVVCLTLAYFLNERFLPTIAPPRPAPFLHRLLVPHNHIAAWLAIGAIVNLFLFLEGIRPFRWGRFSSDGYKLLELLQGKSEAKIAWLTTSLSGALADGIRPREWDRALVELMLSIRDGSTGDGPANLYGYYHALDIGQIQQAGQLIDLAAAHCQSLQPNLKSGIWAEAAFLEGRYRGNASQAQHWLKQVDRNQVERQTYLRAKACALLAEGRFREAADDIEEALKAVPQSTDPGGARAEHDWLIDAGREIATRMRLEGAS